MGLQFSWLTFWIIDAEKEALKQVGDHRRHCILLLNLFYSVLGALGREKLSSPFTARPRAYAKPSMQALRVRYWT